MGEAPLLPQIKLPGPVSLPPRIELRAPSFYVPKYRPVVLPSARQMKEARIKAAEQQKAEQAENSKTKPAQVPAIPQETTTIEVPFIDTPIPVPRPEILSTAVFTAGAASVASVAGTLAAGALLKRLIKVLKPVLTAVLKKIAKARGKNPAESDAKLRWRRRVSTKRSTQNQV